MGNTLFRLVSNLVGKGKSDEQDAVRTIICKNPPVYSWEKKSIKNPDLLKLQGISNEIMHKTLSAELAGQQFIFQNCSESLFSVTSFTDCILIDDCNNCKFILGPVKGSIYLRNCNKCLLAVSCGQLRMRDCTDVTVFLHCCSQPSIESSFRINFNCLSLDYNDYSEQLFKAGLDVSVNLWYQIFDFTPTPLSEETVCCKPDTVHGGNWILLGAENRLEDFLSKDELLHCFNQGLNFDRRSSALPYVHPMLEHET